MQWWEPGLKWSQLSYRSRSGDCWGVGATNKTPVIIQDNVMIGANAVVLEGVKVGKGL